MAGASTKAKRTLQTHDSYWRRFIELCATHELEALPASPSTVAMYLTSMQNSGSTRHMILSSSAAIACAHQLLGVPSPTENSLVANVREGARRHAKHNRRTKAPLTPDQVRQVVDANIYGAKTTTDFQRGLMVLLMFAGFLRASDLSALRWEDIKFQELGMQLYIASSKTDQYKEGRSVPVAKTGDDYCPVELLRLFLELAGLRTSGPNPVFCTLTRAGRVGPRSAPVSYPTVRSWWRQALDRAGIDNDPFCTHSARKGAATSAANMGVSDKVFADLGRWKSASARDSYVTNTNSTLFAASRRLQAGGRATDSTEVLSAFHRRNTAGMSL